MNSRALPIAGALLLGLFGIWAGLRVHTGHAPVRLAAAGGASARAQSDPAPMVTGVDAAFDEGVPTPSKIPEQLPDFSLGDRTGKPTSVSTWRGKSLILNFWATWCAPCRREIPLLESLYAEWGDRDVEVVGIAVDYRDKVVAYADELKIAYPLLIGEQDALDVAAAFGVGTPVFPFTVFTDRRGDIVTLYLGELHKPQADLILSVVQHLDQHRMDLAQARQSIAAGLQALAPKHAG
ncbi:MAG TPA: TlpA disulfide reductase family protein [Steroidobacteraceae bacterium]|nr:TlpA disulfide reductase family protein [Steroidobacteraceae bacterium]